MASQQSLFEKGRIQSATTYVQVGDRLLEHHYYMRFLAEHTELWMFGVGLGDQAAMQQFGEAFLRYCDVEDPQLGRIMVSYGFTATAFMPYKGDYNLWWAWGDSENYVERYFSKVWVKPAVIMVPSNTVKKQVKHTGVDTVYCPLATGTVFHPLGLKRNGLGYSGGDSKSREQTNLILGSFIGRSDFEWRCRRASDEYLTLEKLNEWYNTKQVLFGMVNPASTYMNTLSNRIYETFASGTPLVSPKHNGFEEIFGFPQPYAVEKQGDAERFVNEILNDFPKALEKSLALSKHTLENHTFDQRVPIVMEHLKEMRR